jgi:hypothetical protein
MNKITFREKFTRPLGASDCLLLPEPYWQIEQSDSHKMKISRAKKPGISGSVSGGETTNFFFSFFVVVVANKMIYNN